MLDVFFNVAGTYFALRRSEQPQNLESSLIREPLEQGSELLDGLTSQARPRSTAIRPARSFYGNGKA
jgi:hypothetical protein